jgi:pimeloyl-ACP methyl ester carboxylesterase
MALVSVNATETGWASAAPLETALHPLPPGSSVTVMIHGFRFSPWSPAHDPHQHILSLTPRRDCWKAVSWPRHLHLGGTTTRLGIGLGWHARGGLALVADDAFAIGDTLAMMIREIKGQRADLHVNIIAHSLGARVALCALAMLPRAHVDRLILLSGAEYRSLALAALASPARRTAQVLNVTSGENLLFDAIYRVRVPAPTRTDWPLSAGLPGAPGWIDLRVDCPATLDVLRDFGIRTRRPVSRVCHWSTYLRPGLFRLYRGVCDPSQPDLLPRLAAALQATASPAAPAGPARRLSPL